MIPYILTANSLTVVTEGKVYNVDNTHPNWSELKELVKHMDSLGTSEFIQTLEELIDVSAAIETFGNGLVKVIDGVVTYKDTEVRGPLVTRMLSMIEEGFDVNPLALFLENLMLNPSYKSREDLYRFLDANDLPITPDGCFLAYKNVNDHYMDKHSRTFSNRIGDVCEMPRSDVNDDSNQTCSAGLHVCSKKYLEGFWGTSGHTMVVKVNPRDVVSVPYDYEDSKMRTCKYTVVDEVESIKEDFYDSSVHTTEGEWLAWDCDICGWDFSDPSDLYESIDYYDDIQVEYRSGAIETGQVCDFYWEDCGDETIIRVRKV